MSVDVLRVHPLIGASKEKIAREIANVNGRALKQYLPFVAHSEGGKMMALGTVNTNTWIN